MNPELRPLLETLRGQLGAAETDAASLRSQVDADHPDAGQLDKVIGSLHDALKYLNAIGFGLESETTYDD